MLTEIPIFPFRWDISRPNQLGSLAAVPVDDRYPGFDYMDEVVECCAKILARSDNGDLFFVGRSPDTFYDFLSGALKETSWRDRLRLLHFSFYYHYEEQTVQKQPELLENYHRYLTHLNLDPLSLQRRERPVVLVDLVNEGGTFDRLINLLRDWCEKVGVPWERVRGKIRVVGIVRRDDLDGYFRERLVTRYRRQKQPGSIKERRRQSRHGHGKNLYPYGDWPKLLNRGAVRFFAVERHFWSYLGDYQPKMAVSYKPDRWGQEWVTVPDRQAERLVALKIALAYHREGLSRQGRVRLVHYMNRERRMAQPWYRALLGELVAR